MKKFRYTGVGSLETPEGWGKLLANMAEKFAHDGLVLRSGGAPGADSAWERGALRGGGEVEIYLPWKGARGHTSPLYSVDPRSIEEAIRRNPRCKSSRASTLFHARNISQVLGEDPWDNPQPSAFVLGWTTRPRSDTGGTAFTLSLARDWGIPTFNLLLKEDQEAWKKFWAKFRQELGNA